MEYEELKAYLDRNLTLRQISAESKNCLGSIRHWMKKYGLKPNFANFKGGYKPKQKIDEEGKRYCPCCQTYKKVDEFYSRRKTNCTGYCRKCISRRTTERQRNMKKTMIEYKGGRCQNPNCSTPGGYNRSINGLDFHHIDPAKKEFDLSQMRLSKMNEKIKDELDKCLLLCANCHREVHEEIVLERQKNEGSPISG
jgi:hypothetical protein